MKPSEIVSRAIAKVRSDNAEFAGDDSWEVADVIVSVLDIINAVGNTSSSVVRPILPRPLQPITLEEWNRFAQSLHIDILSLYRGIKELVLLVPHVLAMEDVLRRWQHVYAMSYSVYAEMISQGDIIQERTYSEPEMVKGLIYSSDCFVDPELPGVTAKVTKSEEWKHTSVSLGSDSNGISARRYGKWEKSTIDNMFDNDPTTWHEYELLTHVTESSPPLVLDVIMYNPVPTEVNKVIIDFSVPSHAVPIVASIDVSADGKVYETVFTHGKPSSSGRVVARFLPVKAKYVRVKVEQHSGKVLEFGGEKYVRKSILTRSIEVVSEHTARKGEIILGPFSHANRVEYVEVDADIEGVVETTLSIGDVFRWHPIDVGKRIYINNVMEDGIQEPAAPTSVMVKFDIRTPDALYAGNSKEVTVPVSRGNISVSLPDIPMPGSINARVNAVAYYGGPYGVLLAHAAEEPNKTVKIPQWLRGVKGSITVSGTEWGIVPELGSNGGMVVKHDQQKGELRFGDGATSALPVGDIEMKIPPWELKFSTVQPYKAPLPMPSDGSKTNTTIKLEGIPTYVPRFNLPGGAKRFSFPHKHIVDGRRVTEPVPKGVTEFVIHSIPIRIADMEFDDKIVFSKLVGNSNDLSSDGEWSCNVSYDKGTVTISTYTKTNSTNAGSVSFKAKGVFSRSECGFTSDATSVYVNVIPSDGSPPCEQGITKEVTMPDGTSKTHYYCPLVLSNRQIVIFRNSLLTGDASEKSDKMFTAPPDTISKGRYILLRSYSTTGSSIQEQHNLVTDITTFHTYDEKVVTIATLRDPLEHEFNDSRHPHILYTTTHMIGPMFSDTDTFGNEVPYVDGSSEIRHHGDFSIDYKSGNCYTFDNIKQGSYVSYSHADITELPRESWHFDDANKSVVIDDLRTGKSSMGFAVDSNGMAYLVPDLTRRNYVAIPFKQEYVSNPSKRVYVDGYSVVPETDILRGEFIPEGVTQFTVRASYIVKGTFSVIPVFSSNVCTRSRDFEMDTSRSVSSSADNTTTSSVHSCSLGHTRYNPGPPASGFYEDYCADPAGRYNKGNGCRHYLPPASKVAATFAREKTFVNGVSELQNSGDYSVDYDSGTVYTKDPVPRGAVIQYGGNRYTCSFVACAEIDNDYIIVDGKDITISRSFADVWGIKQFEGKTVVITYTPEGSGSDTQESTRSSIVRNVRVLVGGRDE